MNITKQYLDFRFKALKEALERPDEHQKAALVEVVKSFNNTGYAQHLGFDSEISVHEFIEQVPLCRYDDLLPFIHRMKDGARNLLLEDRIKYYGESSGTTGRNKTLPLSKRYLRECLIKGSIYSASIVNHYVRDATEGKTIVLPGSIKDMEKYMVGDVSAVMSDHIPFLLRHKSAYDTFSRNNMTWKEKMDAIIEAIQGGQKIVGITGLPTWNLKMLDYIQQSEESEQKDRFFRELRFFIHGGISLDPYKERYKQIFKNTDITYISVYNSTEGYFAFQDDPEEDSMSLFVDGNIYYEFISLNDINEDNPPLLNLTEIKKGVPYVMVISNISGLYRYVIEDVVVFSSVYPFKLKIIGRTSGFLNVFGEEVMEDMCNQVVDQLVKTIGIEVNDFTIAPKFENIPVSTSMGCHEWLIEFNGNVDLTELELSILIDQFLKQLSHDYSEKRKDDLIMCRPSISILEKGSFFKYLNLHKKVGVQTKIPRISKSRDLLDKLYAIT